MCFDIEVTSIERREYLMYVRVKFRDQLERFARGVLELTNRNPFAQIAGLRYGSTYEEIEIDFAPGSPMDAASAY